MSSSFARAALRRASLAAFRPARDRASFSAAATSSPHATTVLCVRKDGETVIMADGQVTMGSEIVKPNVKKVRIIEPGVVGGFAGATADAFTLFERLEQQLEQHPGQLTRACVELAKQWRTDKFLRKLEATMIVADKESSFQITGSGDVLEPHDGVIGIGSGGSYALAAARAARARGRRARGRRARAGAHEARRFTLLERSEERGGELTRLLPSSLVGQ